MSKISYMSQAGDTLWGLSGEIIVGSGTRGTLYHTINGGINWTFQIPDTAIHIFYYYHGTFTNRNHGWAYTLGLLGGIHTTNGGDTTFYTGIQQLSNNIPKDFQLKQNYPNPFNPRTVIPFSIKKAGYVKLYVYDILGRFTDKLVDGKYSAGEYEVDFMGKFAPSGVYFYRIEITDESSKQLFSETKKMILVK